MVRQHSARRLWLAVHLYLGLGLGLLLSVVGISGSLLVFYIEIDELLNPELVVPAGDKPRMSYESLYQALRRAEPDRQRGWRLEIPENPQRMITARYYQPQETEHQGFAPLLVSLNPYSGTVVKSRFWGRFAMTWLYDLHYTLLLGPVGKIVMAAVGGLLVLSLVSGVWLWWPPRHKWRQALTWKAGASRPRLIYDLHKLDGVYSLVVMLMLAITGVALEIPEYVNPVLDYFSPLHAAPKPVSRMPDGAGRRIRLDEAIAVARQRFPDARLSWIETPHDVGGSYRINLHQHWEPSRRFPKTNVWVDQYSGQILAVNDPDQFAGSDSVLMWLHPLHGGEALGLAGRLLVLAAGLCCPLLFVTGLWRWLQKRRGRQIKRDRAGKPV